MGGQHSTTGFPGHFYIDGIAFDERITRRDLKTAAETFECRGNDIFIVTYPRSGTTWTIEMVTLLLNDGDTDINNSLLQHVRVPVYEAYVAKLEGFKWILHCLKRLKPWMPSFLQRLLLPTMMREKAILASDGITYLNTMTSQRIIKTHLQPQLFPKQAFEKNCKIIYVARNPKDNMVSNFHHYRNIRFSSYPEETWDHFYQRVLNRKVEYGDWFDHVLGWWRLASKENVCFMKYEDMKKDPRGTINHLAQFLQKEISETTVEQILKHTSFEAMRENPQVNMKEERFFYKEGADFIRKGAVGDWENYFTVGQNEEFEHLYSRKMAGSDLSFEW